MDTASHNFRHEPSSWQSLATKESNWNGKKKDHSQSTPPKLKLFFFYASRLPEITYCHFFFFSKFLLGFFVGMLVWALSQDLFFAWAESLCYFPKDMFRSITPAPFLCWWTRTWVKSFDTSLKNPFLLIPFSQNSLIYIQRKNGLFKKAYELVVLCSVDVAVIIFGSFTPLARFPPFFRISWLFNRSIFIF